MTLAVAGVGAKWMLLTREMFAPRAGWLCLSSDARKKPLAQPATDHGTQKKGDGPNACLLSGTYDSTQNSKLFSSFFRSYTTVQFVYNGATHSKLEEFERGGNNLGRDSGSRPG